MAASSANAPKLTKEQVAKAFSTWGYTPDERDLSWWTTQGANAYTKLVSNLKARKELDDNRIKDRAKQAAAERDMQNSFKETVAGPEKGQTVVSTVGGKTKLYPMGGYSLVKFSDNPTVWLADFNNKELRPFLSENAFNTSYPNPEEAMKSVVVLDPSEHIQQGGAFSDFELLPNEYGIAEQGQMKDKEFRLNNLKNRYGQPELPVDTVISGLTNFSQFLGALKNNPNSGVDPAFIEKIKNDKDLGALYGMAMIYGGYNFDDVYKDIKKRELTEKGDTQYQNMKFIDDKMTKDKYLSTPEGQASSKNMLFSVPPEFSAVDPGLFNLSVFKLPPEAFKKLNPTLDITDKSFKADAEKIQSSFHDILMQKLTAQTEEDKAVADSSWNRFKSELEDAYNIKLSNNAIQAWDQIQNITQKGREAGISGSGIEAENIDDYLKSVRRQNDIERKSKLSTEETEAQKYYSSFASPEQVKQLMEEDKAKGLPREQWRVTKWGLLPSQEMIDSLDINTLKQKFPGVPEEQLQAYRNEIIDENGLARSTLYGNYEKNKRVVATGEKPMEEAFSESKQDFQTRKLYEKNLAEEEKAAKEFTKATAEDMFSSADAGTPKEKAQETTPTTAEATQKEPSGYSNISSLYPGGMPSGAQKTPQEQQKPASWTPSDSKKVKIPGPSQLGGYTNIEKNPTPGALDLWGVPKQAQNPAVTPQVKTKASPTNTQQPIKKTPVPVSKPSIPVKKPVSPVKPPVAPAQKTPLYTPAVNQSKNQSLYTPATPQKSPFGGDYPRSSFG